MKKIKSLFKQFARDEQGGEVIEYALIAGMIIVVCIAVIGAFGTKVVARWSSVNGKM
jgi:Flp pilus assembly pilin Flp